MFGALNSHVRVAKLVRPQTDNLEIVGSSPTPCTIAHCADCKILYMFVGTARQAFVTYDACGENPYTKSVGVPR